MNILRQELKRTFPSWLYFTIGMLAAYAAFASFFNVFRDDAALLDQILQNFPPEFRAAFGFADVNLGEVAGYLSFVISFVVLIGAVFGMKQGVSLLSEEVRVKTADFLLSKPVPRSRIVTGKLAATLLAVIAQNIIFYASSLAFTALMIAEPMDGGILALLCFSNFFIQLFFIGAGLAIAAILPKIKSVMPITLGFVFFFFIIEMINESLLEKVLTYVTPFAYFKGAGILASRSYDSSYLAVDLAVFVGLTALSYWVYQKKDIHAI